MFITNHRRKTATMVPLASMAAARGIEGGWMVTDNQGGEHPVSDFEMKLALEMTPASTFPALPGTYLLNRATDASDNPEIYRITVLGWMISADGDTRPIVLDAEARIDDGWAVQMPDGRVEDRAGSQWESPEAWLTDNQAKAEAQ